MKRCPFCAEEIQDAAIVCRFCNRDLPQQAPKMVGGIVVDEGFTSDTSASSTPRQASSATQKVIIKKPAKSGGTPNVAGIGCLSVIGIVVVLMVIGVLNSPSTRSTSSSSSAAEPQGTVLAKDLVFAYQGNEVSADAIYKGRRFQIGGVVTSIGKDILDSPYVTLGQGGSLEINTVQAMFTRGRDEGALAPLSKGQQLTVTCTIRGKVLVSVLADTCTLAP